METLRLWRRRKGWTQTDLAKNTGVHIETISGIEAGRHEPRPSTLTKLANVLGVEVEELFRKPGGGECSCMSREELQEVVRETVLATLETKKARNILDKALADDFDHYNLIFPN